jgi:hypothetical protein
MKKEIRSMEIAPAENGGHTVTHRYKELQREGKHGLQSSYVEPEHHVFGPDEGHEMLAHVANHLAIPEMEGEDEEEGDEKPRREGKHEGKGRMTAERAKRVREKVA